MLELLVVLSCVVTLTLHFAIAARACLQQAFAERLYHVCVFALHAPLVCVCVCWRCVFALRAQKWAQNALCVVLLARMRVVRACSVWFTVLLAWLALAFMHCVRA